MTHVLVAQACSAILKIIKEHKEYLAVKKKHSASLKAHVANFTSQLSKVGEILRTWRSKERRSLVKVKTLDVQQRNVIGHLPNIRTGMPGF